MTEPKPKIMVENISCILPEENQLGGLFLGNVYGAQNATILKEYGIRAVLTSSIQTDINYSTIDIPFHMKIQAHDKQNYNLKQHINQCIHFIQQARRQLTNVYVHCFAGVSRSVAIVCAYIMWKLKWNYETTMAFVKAKRIVAKPNEGFVRQLMEIEQVLMEVEGGASYLQYESKVDDNSKISQRDSSLISNNSNNINSIPQPITSRKQSITTKQPPVNIIEQKPTLPYNISTELYNNPNSSTSSSFGVKKLTNLPQQQINTKQNDIKYKQSETNVQRRQSFGLAFVNESSVKRDSINGLNHQTNRKNSHQNDNQVQLNGYGDNEKRNKLVYLQNFFPQNHPQSPQMPPSNKQRANHSTTSTEPLQQYMTATKPLSVTSTSSLNKVHQLNNVNSFKNINHGYIQHKPSSEQHQLILGGSRKPSANHHNSTNHIQSSNHHNSTNIHKIQAKRQYTQSTNQSFDQSSNNLYNQNRTPAQSNYYSTSSNQYYSNQYYQPQYYNVQSPQKNQYLYNANTKQQRRSNQLMEQPVENVYNSRKFDFRNTAPSDGFFKAQKKQIQKTTSRCMIRPKDLPGYKNY